MADGIKVRFAPSPTGFLHLGNARTAIINWLFARHHRGTFVLRVEDTDRQRSTDEALNVILDALKWLGLDWGEGPYYQSERIDLYRKHVHRLLDAGRAFKCYCTPEEVADMREKALKEGKNPIYDGRCRDRTEPRPGIEPVVRFKSPSTGETVLDDLIQGRIVVQNSETDDLVLLRPDGSPTYNLSVVVDDHLMGITHVIRGADHITNTPRQIQLYQALEFGLPRFAHHGLILGPDRSKLSKRHGAVSVLHYRESGYLPEALVNALVRVGWSHGDQELFTADELVELFDLDKVSSSPAIFDFNKLDNLFNTHHMQAADTGRLTELLVKHLALRGVEIAKDDSRIPLLLENVVQRSKTIVEMAEKSEPLVAESVDYDEKAVSKHLTAETVGIIEEVRSELAGMQELDPEVIMNALKKLAEKRGLKLGKVAQPVRVALTGGTASPSIDAVIMILGRERTLERLETAVKMARG
ncbi:glutamate--tRNA ligase [Thermodesulfobacteriota bacterium]